MFEKEIKFIADVNLNKIKNLGSFITFEKFDGSDVHPAVKQYISAELDYLIHEDRKKLLEQSVFDYSGPETGKLFNAIAQEVKKNKKISYEDIRKLILQAVSFNINFIVRPKWSLVKLVYNDADVKTAEEIKLNLNYVYFFEYLKNILSAYLSKRKILSLSSIEFETILDKIDREVFSTDEKKMIDFSLYTMAEFFNSGAADKKVLRPVAAELFLKEKNQIDKVIRLRKAFSEGSKQNVSIEEIKRVIFSSEPLEYDAALPEEDEDLQIETDAEKLRIREISLHDEKKRINVPEKEDETRGEDFPDDNNSPASPTDETEETAEITETEKDPESESESVDETVDENTFDSGSTDLSGATEELSGTQNEIADGGTINEELETGSGTELDDSFLAFYESELKTLEEDIAELDAGKSGETELPEKEDFESLYNFEEETGDLIKNFSEDTDDKTDPPEALPESDEILESDELEFEESEELTREFLRDDNIPEDEEIILEPGSEDMLEDEPRNAGKSRKRKEEDLFDYLSNKDIERIVANVFNDDRDDFANTMEKLAECGNYEEATEILKGVFLTYRVNPYSKEAVTLTNSVSNYFEQD